MLDTCGTGTIFQCFYENMKKQDNRLGYKCCKDNLAGCGWLDTKVTKTS